MTTALSMKPYLTVGPISRPHDQLNAEAEKYM